MAVGARGPVNTADISLDLLAGRCGTRSEMTSRAMFWKAAALALAVVGISAVSSCASAKGCLKEAEAVPLPTNVRYSKLNSS